MLSFSFCHISGTNNVVLNKCNLFTQTWYTGWQLVCIKIITIAGHHFKKNCLSFCFCNLTEISKQSPFGSLHLCLLLIIKFNTVYVSYFCAAFLILRIFFSKSHVWFITEKPIWQIRFIYSWTILNKKENYESGWGDTFFY